jgi:TPR repeat protein
MQTEKVFPAIQCSLFNGIAKRQFKDLLMPRTPWAGCTTTVKAFPMIWQTVAQWYRKAAVQGFAPAELALGMGYCNGDGVPQDMEIAGQWYRKAAKHGSLDAIVKIQNPRNCQRTKLEVHLKQQGGVLLAPVLINGRISLDFVVDSGAADVSLPGDVVSTLMRTGTLTAADFTGSKTYVLADGSRIPSQTLRIRSLQVGDMVLKNVPTTISSTESRCFWGRVF